MNELAAKEQEVKQEIINIDNQVLSLRVIDTETYLQAGEIFKAISAMEKKIKAFFDPLCKKADEAHKALTSAKAIEIAKLAPLKAHINKEQTDWNVEQERLRRLEEDRLRREAEKAEEDRRLQAAIEAEQAGEKEEAAAVLEEPLYVPPPIVEKTVPKQAGLAMTTTWRWRLKDINLVPRQFLNINETVLNAHVKNLKDRSNVPGIEVYPESSMRGVRS